MLVTQRTTVKDIEEWKVYGGYKRTYIGSATLSSWGP